MSATSESLIEIDDSDEFPESPKYHSSQVEIGLYDNGSTISYYTADGTHRESNDINVILSKLGAFCPQFSHLTIRTHNFPYYYGYTQRIVESVNNFCANVPQTVCITSATKIDQILTFQNASSVILHRATPYNADVINKMFPQMSKLDVFTEHRYSLNGNFPNLQHFGIQENANGLFDLKVFGAFNRQIRSVIVTFDWDLQYLRELNENFPQLENLELVPLFNGAITTKVSRFFKSLITKPIETIRFRCVSAFTFHIHFLYFRYSTSYPLGYHHNINREDWVRDRLSVLKFDQLKSYKLITMSKNFVDEQIDLIAENKRLTSVDLSVIELTHGQMERLMTELPTLKEVTLECKSMGTIDNIVRLMNESKLEVVNVNVPEKRRNKYSKKFSTRSIDGWSCARSNEHLENRLTFVRNRAN